MNDFPTEYEKNKLDEMYAQLGLPVDAIKLLHSSFAAFAELYNIISLHDAFDIFKRHNGDLVSKDGFIAFSEIVRHEKGHYFYILGADELYDDVPVSEAADREIVHCSLFDIDDDYYYGVADIQEGKPFYIPSKDEFLKYEDDLYIEQTPQTKAMYDFFHNKMGFSDERADEMTADCVMSIKCAVIPEENPMESAVNCLNFTGIEFTKFQEAEFIRLLRDLANNTRLGCNRGFTPNELADRFGFGKRKTIAGISAKKSGRSFNTSEIGLVDFTHDSIITGSKVGRNDPCPCGSGKKYKKCCGRSR